MAKYYIHITYYEFGLNSESLKYMNYSYRKTTSKYYFTLYILMH